jgi:sRNA-binding carbon storage regulator CsrA
MGLILSLREGEHLTIGETRFEVLEILKNRNLILQDPEGTCWEINDDRACEVLPTVWISAGDRARHQQSARVVIEAPRSIPVRRGDRKDGRPPTDPGPDQEGNGPG